MEKEYTEYELERIRIERLKGHTITVPELRHLAEMVKSGKAPDYHFSDLECNVYEILSSLHN